MPLQFFHVEDLCRFIEIILDKKPENHIFNVGNPEMISINDWVEMCYDVVGSSLEKIYVNDCYGQKIISVSMIMHTSWMYLNSLHLCRILSLY